MKKKKRKEKKERGGKKATELRIIPSQWPLEPTDIARVPAAASRYRPSLLDISLKSFNGRLVHSPGAWEKIGGTLRVPTDSQSERGGGGGYWYSTARKKDSGDLGGS